MKFYISKFVLFACLLVAPNVWAAISWDANSNSGAVTNSQNPSHSHTRGAVCANPVAVIRVTSQDSTPGTLSSVTYGGSGATILSGTTHKRADPSGTTVSRSIWIYKNPPSGPSTVQANFSEVMNTSIISVSTYCGVDQTTTVGTAAEAENASGAASVTVSSASGELVVDVVVVDTGSDASLTVDASQTERANVNSASNHRHGGSEEAGAASVVMSWALGGTRYWGSTGVALKPATATATTQPLMLLGVGN
mgnify:FL=1